MESLTKSYDCLAGMDLVRQDYLATLSELKSDASLTEVEQNPLRRELAVEHRVRCTKSGRRSASNREPTRM
jgi:hypothetical protein